MNIEHIISFFKEIPIFSNLSPEEIQTFIYIAKERFFEKGQAIFYEEDMGTSFYIIVSGQVKIVMLSSDGREHILGVLKDKDFFGEMSLLDGEPRSATAIALEDVKVLSISRDAFMKLLRENPDICLKILVTLSKRLRQTDKRVESLAFLSAPGRVARTLLEFAKEHGEKKDDDIHVHHKMIRQEFANIAGTSRETLTRVLMDFQGEGILTVKKNLIILHSLNRLKEKIV